MKKKFFITAIILCSILSTQTLFAKIVVVSTQGEVAYRDEKMTQWMPLKAGTELQNGVRISTGVRATATINLSGNTVNIGSLTMMKVYENRLIDSVQETNIGMRRGSMVADVTKGERIRTVFRVSTPVVTSAVRGTTLKVDTGLSGTSVRVSDGSVRVNSRSGQSRVLSGRLVYNLPAGAMEPRPILTNSVSVIAPAGSTEREQASAEIFSADFPQGTDVQIQVDRPTHGTIIIHPGQLNP